MIRALLICFAWCWLSIGVYVDVAVETRPYQHKPGGWTWVDRAEVIARGPFSLWEMMTS